MKVFIAGCGWLGCQLAVILRDAGYRVYGSRRTDSGLNQLPEGITPVLLDLSSDLVDAHLEKILHNAIVICSIPPGRQPATDYLKTLSQLASLTSQAGSLGLIHLSSSGIYQGIDGDVDESVLLKTDQPRVALLQSAENILKQSVVPCLTLRLGGLFGPGRGPGHFVAGKTLPNRHGAVNMVHATDVCRALLQILGRGHLLPATYNLCSPQYLNRQNFYQRACELVNSTVNFSDEPMTSHRVLSDRFMTSYAFSFSFANAIDGLSYCNL